MLQRDVKLEPKFTIGHEIDRRRKDWGNLGSTGNFNVRRRTIRICEWDIVLLLVLTIRKDALAKSELAVIILVTFVDRRIESILDDRFETMLKGFAGLIGHFLSFLLAISLQFGQKTVIRNAKVNHVIRKLLSIIEKGHGIRSVNILFGSARILGIIFSDASNLSERSNATKIAENNLRCNWAENKTTILGVIDVQINLAFLTLRHRHLIRALRSLNGLQWSRSTSLASGKDDNIGNKRVSKSILVLGHNKWADLKWQTKERSIANGRRLLHAIILITRLLDVTNATGLATLAVSAAFDHDLFLAVAVLQWYHSILLKLFASHGFALFRSLFLAITLRHLAANSRGRSSRICVEHLVENAGIERSKPFKEILALRLKMLVLTNLQKIADQFRSLLSLTKFTTKIATLAQMRE